jgi:CarD family transcriptional regulator
VESSAARVQASEGFARVAAHGHLKGADEPLAAAARDSQTSNSSRPERTAMALAAGQTRYNKPGLPGQSAVHAQKPARTTNLPRPPFKSGEYVVYPSHGVGQIIAIEEQEVAGFTLELFVLSFAKDKMTLKVPVAKATAVGMRKLADAGAVKVALDTLAGRARIKRTMWSRRAQEYEAKINSGDLNAIAEVVRDLYRSDTQPEQSYSERQLYEAALDRMAREIVVVQRLTETESLKVIEAHLQKGPRRGKPEEAEEPDIEEAA